MSFLGTLGYNIYYKPRSWVKAVQRNGGLANNLAIERGRQAMDKAALLLQTESPPAGSPEVYFLTGKKFWTLTAFCMYSLSMQSNNTLKPVFIDDGTLDDQLIKNMRGQFPGCIIRNAKEIEKTIETVLPISKYPLLHKKRKIYPHIKKLTDVHAGAKGWKMVLDSDMLFFNYPDEIIDWLTKPAAPFFLYDPVLSYHYTIELMEELSGGKIIPNLNVGAVGLKSEQINWDKLEAWIGTLEENQGTNYLLEQALSAMLVSGQNPKIANKCDYVVMPEQGEVDAPSAILHHYVADSK